MISNDALRAISNIFIGDVGDYYTYKSGPKLVSFFNDNFNFEDVYGQGFPSRWSYAYDKIVAIINSGKVNLLLDIILGSRFIIKEKQCSAVEALELSKDILLEFNRILKADGYLITDSNGQHKLIQENQDLIFLGDGGFATVYKQKSTGLVIKKLKEDFLTNKGIRSRFKREYLITKSLSDIPGIIEVYDFNESDYTYTMKLAEQTFEKYMLNAEFNDATKTTCIRMILQIMKEVHGRDIIHRDLSPNNIFIMNGQIIIADFGLGKDLNMFTSHQTLHTNAVGQYSYCAPEQFMLLKDGDKRSDVYSLGRIINFIMTLDPNNAHHHFRSVAEKATNSDAAYRYSDAGQLSTYFEKSVAYNTSEENKKIVEEKIKMEILDDDVEAFLYEIPASKICTYVMQRKKGFLGTVFKFMNVDDNHEQHIIQSIDKEYRNCCKTYESNDPFAEFAYGILMGKYSYVTNDIAANMLRYVAKEVNRYTAQHLVEKVLEKGVEPLIEEILES